MKISIKIALINLLQLIAFNIFAQVKSADCSKTDAAVSLNNQINKKREVNNTVNLDDASRNLELCESCAYLAVYGCQCQSSDYDGDRAELTKAINETLHQIKVWKSHNKNWPDYCEKLVDQYSTNWQANPCATFKAKAGANGTGGKTEEKPKGPSDAKQLNDGVLNVANTLGANSNDPSVKKTATDMNIINSEFNQAKGIYAPEDIDDKAIETLDKIETVALGVAMIANFLGTEELTPAQRAELNREQDLAEEQVKELDKQLFELYKKKNENYNKATAKYRLLLLRWLVYDSKIKKKQGKQGRLNTTVFLNRSELKTITEQTENEAKNNSNEFILKKIDEIIVGEKWENLYHLRNNGLAAELEKDKKLSDIKKRNETAFFVPDTINFSKEKFLKITQNGENKFVSFTVYPSTDFIELFKSTDIKKGWDGKYQNEDQPAGKYVYTLQGIGEDDGTNLHGSWHKVGYFILAR